MKLIIEIPDNEYDNILKGHWIGNPLADYIKNGTPLPKGHGRIGDFDVLEKELRTRLNVVDCVRAVENSPTIIEADKEVEK